MFFSVLFFVFCGLLLIRRKKWQDKSKPTEEYKGKLLKLIPSEIVAAYMVLQGMIPEDKGKWGSVIVTLVLLIITPFYLKKFEKVKETFQIIGSSLTFVVWVYSLGGPFKHWDLHEPWIASIVLVLWTLIIPLLFKTQPVEE